MSFLRLIFVVSFLIILYPFQQVFAGNADENKTLKIEASGKSFKSIVDSIAEQSGYQIKVSDDLLELQIKGSYKSDDIDKIFQRILRGYNVFQIIDTRKKELLILTNLRNEIPVYSSSPANNGNGSIGSTTILTPQDIEVFPGTTLADIRKRQTENTRKLNSGEIDFIMEGDISLTEVRKQLSQNRKDIDAGVMEIEAIPGHSLKDILESRKEYLNTHDSNTIAVGETGVTLKELETKQRENEAKIRSGELDNGIVNGAPGAGY